MSKEIGFAWTRLTDPQKEIWRVQFLMKLFNEIFAKNIYQSDMYAFLEVEEFIFGSDDQLVVDPSSEKLKNEFKKVYFLRLKLCQGSQLCYSEILCYLKEHLSTW